MHHRVGTELGKLYIVKNTVRCCACLTRRTESILIFVLNKDGIPLDFVAFHFEINVVNVGWAVVFWKRGIYRFYSFADTDY